MEVKTRVGNQTGIDKHPEFGKKWTVTCEILGNLPPVHAIPVMVSPERFVNVKA